MVSLHPYHYMSLIMETLFLAYNRLIENVSVDYLRYLYGQIDWNERLIGIKGARGVGKTTLMRQRIKLAFADRTKAFYVSLDNIWFTTHTLSELVEYLYTHGITHIFLDEVHRYRTWIIEIKNIYDNYPSLHIVFTGSSLLEIDNAEADLSRRLRMYTLRGLSFREYLELRNIAKLPVLPLSSILNEHVKHASSITSQLKVLPYFEEYQKVGYYPFFMETSSPESYYERLQRVVNTVIDNDIPAVEHIEYETLQKAKRLLMILAQTVPFTPNMSSLCEALATTRNQLLHLLSLLERSALIRQLHSNDKKLKSLVKPDKILIDNPNLMEALHYPAESGSVRESFFVSMLSHSHSINYATQGDLLVDSTYTFEVGGKGKGFAQIRNLPNSYVVADGIEIGFGNKIPLWIFGLMY